MFEGFRQEDIFTSPCAKIRQENSCGTGIMDLNDGTPANVR